MAGHEFEQIYKAYFKDVYLFAKSLSGDEHIAEDIASETFLKAIGAISQFKGTCDIRVWLCQIAKNSYYSFLRKSRKVVLTEEPGEPAGEPDIIQKIMTGEDTMRLHEILHCLEEPYKEVFSLRVFGELSFKNIGALFQKTENWACVTYHRAKKKIKEQMEAEK